MAKVLLVEDDVHVAASASGALRLRDHDVVVAGSLAEAREARREFEAFDVILCDYELPDGVGTEFLNEVIADGDGGKTITILWSGLDRRDEVRADMLAPPDYVTTKDKAPEVIDLIEAQVTT